MSDSSEIITSVQKLSLKTSPFFLNKDFFLYDYFKKIPWQAKFKPLVMRVSLCFQVIGRKQVSALSSYEIILKYKTRTNVFKCHSKISSGRVKHPNCFIRKSSRCLLFALLRVSVHVMYYKVFYSRTFSYAFSLSSLK